MTDHVLAIAQDLFTAMVDGEPGLLTAWPGAGAELVEPVHAWVDVRGSQPVRALVTTESVTAERLSRALLGMGPEGPVSPADVRDAFGEVANVIGGNLKGLMPEGGTLGLPVVTHGATGLTGAPVWECLLRWRAQALVISMWHLHTERKEPTS